MRGAGGCGELQRGWSGCWLCAGQRRRSPPGGVDVEFGSTGAENSRLKNAFENGGTNFRVG